MAPVYVTVSTMAASIVTIQNTEQKKRKDNDHYIFTDYGLAKITVEY